MMVGRNGCIPTTTETSGKVSDDATDPACAALRASLATRTSAASGFGPWDDLLDRGNQKEEAERLAGMLLTTSQATGQVADDGADSAGTTLDASSASSASSSSVSAGFGAAANQAIDQAFYPASGAVGK